MKTIIFDMYGVILKDPDGNLMPFLNSVLPELTPTEVYRHWAPADIGAMTSLDFFKNLGFEGDLAKIEKEYLDTIEIDEAFFQAAQSLKARYRLALLSNDLSEWSRYLREKFSINSLFDTVVVSGDVKLKKPDPEIFNLILKKLSCPASDCIFVDDRRKNLDAAQALGMEVILFNSRNVPYDGKTANDFNELTDMLLNS